MSKKEEKVYMPMGAGGLIRYAEEEKQKIRLQPKHVVWIVTGVVALELLLKFLA